MSSTTNESNSRPARRGLRTVAATATLTLIAAGCAAGVDPERRQRPEGEETATTSQAVTGNIAPDSIQIDTTSDLFDDVGVPLNAGATLDWVADELDNAGTDCLGDDSVAACIEEGITGAAGGVGHWSGIRLVDRIASDDRDIFLQGGKENDLSTWTIGPGTVGSSKYDLTQAYLANNQDSLHFGMERRGNNGTTAFDFEFNQQAPESAGCIQNPLIPCRTTGDVLFTFVMQGAGNSGSAVPHVYQWSGTTFGELTQLPDGVRSSINTVIAAHPPWGRVDQHGDWVLEDFPKFELAEAIAPISLLPGVDECGGTAYVQVRTRASSTANSDLKDTSKVFEFQFNSATAEASLTGSCDGTFAFAAVGKDADGENLVNPTCAWTFQGPDGTSTSADCAGTLPSSPGTVSASVVVTPEGSAGCAVTVDAGTVELLGGLTIELELTGAGESCPDMTTDGVTYTANPGGGNGAYTVAWSNTDCGTDATCTIGSGSGFCHDETLSATVTDSSGLCPPVNSELETYSKVTTVTASDL